MQARPLRLAASALLAGGLLLGVAPMPLSNSGCGPALGGSDDALDPATVIQIACSDTRASRQDLVAVILTSGAAVLGLSFRRPRPPAADAGASTQ